MTFCVSVYYCYIRLFTTVIYVPALLLYTRGRGIDPLRATLLVTQPSHVATQVHMQPGAARFGEVAQLAPLAAAGSFMLRSLSSLRVSCAARQWVESSRVRSGRVESRREVDV